MVYHSPMGEQRAIVVGLVGRIRLAGSYELLKELFTRPQQQQAAGLIERIHSGGIWATLA
jgi:hypothetical protein